jgi:hypothetical protein
MVPIDNQSLHQYNQTGRVEILIEAAIEGLVIYQDLEVWQGEVLLPRGFVPVRVDVPSTMIQPDDTVIISSAYLTAREWQVRHEASGEAPTPIRLFLECLEGP